MSIGRRRFLQSTGGLATGLGTGLISGIALTTTGRSHAAESTRPSYGIEGAQAPEIALDYWIDADGEKTSFSVTEARGKWVFLKCFQNWCPGCHSSGFPTLKAFSDEFHNHPKVAIAGIQTVFEGFTSNTLEDVRKLQLRYELPIVMGHDPGDPESGEPPVTMRGYRTGGTPWMILINPDGRVVFNDFHVDRQKLINYVGEQVA